MTLSYEFDSRFTALAPVLDEQAEWFGQLMRRLVYPEAEASSLPELVAFVQWSASAGNEEGERTALQAIRRVYDEMQTLANDLITAARPGVRPDLKVFDHLTDLYETFVLQLRRLERDSVLADSGIDPSTGLRSRKALERDLERELERRARSGRPFCLVLCRFDNGDALRQSISPDEMRSALEKVAGHILRCIRSFDDAYRSGDTEFVMALKHSNTVGGSAAVARLRRALTEHPVLAGDRGQAITLSYCVGEPVPGDDMETLLTNMRGDLDRYDQGGNTALEYFEMSPLQRFIKEDAGGER